MVNRNDTPNKSVIVRFWYEYGLDKKNDWDNLPIFVQRLIVDVGEPFCWGCHAYSAEWDFTNFTLRGETRESTLENLFKNWDRIQPLQRCHIIPHARGGTVEPDNLVLMCESCHSEAPTTIDRNHMLSWMNTRQEQVIELEALKWKNACKPFNLKPEVLLERFLLIKAFAYSDYLDFSAKLSVTHGMDIYPMTSEVYGVLHFPVEKIEQGIALTLSKELEESEVSRATMNMCNRLSKIDTKLGLR